MSLCLLVDTTMQGAVLGLVKLGGDDIRPLWSAAHFENLGSARALPLLVDHALRSCQIKLSEIEAMTIATGPGSFTGIKVGLAFAYGLAAPAARRFLGVSSLSAAAKELALTLDAGEIAVFLPATKAQGYLVIAGGNAREHIVDLDAVATDVVIQSERVSALTEVVGGRRLFLASPWPALTEHLQRAGLVASLLPLSLLSSYALCGMAKDALKAWPEGFSTALPEPSYKRGSAPEERLKKQGKVAQ